MTARVTAHFSLVQAAPLDLRTGALRNLPAADDPAGRDRRGGGGVGVPLRSVLCRLLPVDGHVRRRISLVAVERRPLSVQRVWWRTAFNLLLLSLAGLIVGIALRGGGRLELFGLRISMTRLYTPVLLFTAHARGYASG